MIDRIKEYTPYITLGINFWFLFIVSTNKTEKDQIALLTSLVERVEYLQKNAQTTSDELRAVAKTVAIISTDLDGFKRGQEKEDNRQNEEIQRLSAGVAIIREKQKNNGR